jgi:hypothetical protein
MTKRPLPDHARAAASAEITAHPLVVELFRALPPSAAEFTAERRAAWLRAAAAIFILLYGAVGNLDITWSEDS